ncbi:type II toxin-antitoxin system RelE/ParE family toxin [Saccharopolyspora sp. ID03-671]|uniref:type II toxin-antitoxin system RelE family toxin n=1 Tax=Saccharopolyspora sp. ID03-671 TaxID=3073066 RepID=UPI003253B61A
MTYSVDVTNNAIKTLQKLDKQTRRRIQSAILQLEEDPRPPGAIALKGMKDHFRIRVGHYRVIYSIDDGHLMVLVIRVGHRREVYER